MRSLIIIVSSRVVQLITTAVLNVLEVVVVDFPLQPLYSIVQGLSYASVNIVVKDCFVMLLRSLVKMALELGIFNYKIQKKWSLKICLKIIF